MTWPLLLRKAGLMGVATLRAVLGLSGDSKSTMLRIVESELVRRTLTGETSTSDLARIAYVEQSRLSASGQTNSTESRAQNFVRSLIVSLAPKMTDSTLTPEQLAAMGNIWKSKKEAEARISSIPVTDRGAEYGRAEVNKVFAKAIRGQS